MKSEMQILRSYLVGVDLVQCKRYFSIIIFLYVKKADVLELFSIQGNKHIIVLLINNNHDKRLYYCVTLILFYLFLNVVQVNLE